MGCVCGTRHNYDRVFTDYWKVLSIRYMKADTYCEKIKSYRMRSLLYDVNMKNKFITDFFDSSYNKPITKEMIYDKINTFKTETNDFLLSLIFLTIKDKDKAKKAFQELDKFYDIGSVVVKDNTLYIRKVKLVDILVYYVNLISLYSVTYLATLSDDKQDCIHEMSENFKFEFQITLINNWLEKYAHSDFINFEEFFENEYFQFADDVAVRDGLSCIYYEIRQNNFK
jgi:hypothetical protein